MLAVFTLLGGTCPGRMVIAKTAEAASEMSARIAAETADAIAREQRPGFGPATPFPQWMA